MAHNSLSDSALSDAALTRCQSVFARKVITVNLSSLLLRRYFEHLLVGDTRKENLKKKKKESG